MELSSRLIAASAKTIDGKYNDWGIVHVRAVSDTPYTIDHRREYSFTILYDTILLL